MRTPLWNILATGFVCFSAPLLHAAVILKTDTVSGWTVTRTASSATSGNYQTISYDGTPTTTPVVAVTSTGSWNAKNDSRLSTASWVSNLATSGFDSADGYSTRYVYQASFTLASPQNLELAFAADNLVDQVILSTQPGGAGSVIATWNNTVLPLGDANSNGVGRIWGFTQANVQSFTTTGSGNIYVTATAYNYASGSPGHGYGFIMAINATPVPEPGTLIVLAAPISMLLAARRRAVR